MPGAETETKSEIKRSSRLHEEEKDGQADAADLDDKLYCVCKTSYDEDRVMIACDRCVHIMVLPLEVLTMPLAVTSGTTHNVLICQTSRSTWSINSSARYVLPVSCAGLHLLCPS